MVYEPTDTLPASAEVLGGLLIKNEKGTARCDYDEAMLLAQQPDESGRRQRHAHHLAPDACRAGYGTLTRSRNTQPARFGLPDRLCREHRTSAGPDGTLCAPHRSHRGAQSEYRNNFFVNAGCAFITSEFLVPANFDGNPKRGLDINAGYQFTMRGIGFGLRYSGYYTSGELNREKDRMRLHYFAPEFVLRQALSDRWSINESIGAGYAMYRENFRGLTGKVGGFGYHVNLGIEYKIARGLGVNLGAGVYSARFCSMDSLAKEVADKKAGITRISLHGGFRFYF